MYLFHDPLYLILALPALLLGLWAQYKVRSSYGKWSQVANERGLTGQAAARELLQVSGLHRVSLEGTPGELSDHYDPRSKVLRLSQAVAHGRSVAALGIVAHEVGHALQDARGYAPLRLRNAIVPGVRLGTWLGPILFFVGLLLQSLSMTNLGLLLFSLAAVFALVTLPVELNASRRAMALLSSHGLVSRPQMDGVRAVLGAAALTYVAALLQAVSQLLYFAMLAAGMRRR